MEGRGGGGGGTKGGDTVSKIAIAMQHQPIEAHHDVDLTIYKLNILLMTQDVYTVRVRDGAMGGAVVRPVNATDKRQGGSHYITLHERLDGVYYVKDRDSGARCMSM